MMIGLGLGLTATRSTGGGAVVYNREILLNSAYQTLLTDAKNGVQRPVLMLGDSFAFGFGSNAVTAKMRYSGLANILADNLAAGGVKSVAQGWYGNGRLHGGTNAYVYDDRITVNTDYGQGINSLGGASMVGTSAASWTFAPIGNVDSIDIYYYRSITGRFSYSIDGGAAVEVNAAGTASVQKIGITGLSLGAHSVTIAWVSGGFYWFGADGFDSSKAGFKFINGAINGGVLADFKANTNAYDPLKAAAALAPSLAFMMIGANHWNSGGSLTTFNDDLQIIIDAFATICPLVLVSDMATNPNSPTDGAPLATQKTYVDAMRDKALANDLVMFDEWTAMGGMGSNFDNGNWYSDKLHASGTGFQVMAGHMSETLLAAV